jgi:ABC-type branched-subunit amino acid transport system substrate-binding protein
MVQRFKLIVLFCGFALLAAAWHVREPAAAQTSGAGQEPSVATVASARGLTLQEKHGRAIYLRGESAAGRQITAIVGELDVPSNSVPCAGCHGRRGEGKSEGGVTAGNLTWANLTKSYGHTHPSGRKHGPFTDSSFITAVARGVDPARNNLAAAMPRYRMAPEDMADLLAYLKQIDFERDPGLTPESIDVGIILPTTGFLAETGTAMREILAAYFADVNDRGGIYNRKIKLHVVESGGAAATLTNLRALAQQGQTFAFVGGLSAGADREVAMFALEEEVPLVGPATLLPATGQPPNRYVFYLMPGVAEEARALVNFADTTLSLKQARALVLYPEEELATAAANGAAAQAQQRGWRAAGKRTYQPGSFDAARLAQELKAQRTEAIFFFGSGEQSVALISALDTLNWTPHLFLLGALASKEIAGAVSAGFKQKIFLAFPTVPADVTAQGAAEYRALSEKYKLSSHHPAAQLSALAAGKIFVEGLKRAGADLNREQLVTALEGLYDYDTGLTPRIIFGPNRRIGAAGAYMVTIDPETKGFVSASGWVTVN